ncbi:unnamed protein product [Paramecium octaurelia]|uniref:Uncharacterized protein n=1 Tax=Paramecium octaurelia TaxID=43137 RepID=A0A8S1W5G3_PAROT|nr:unnamed protein product [Paramecium octaurelia]
MDQEEEQGYFLNMTLFKKSFVSAFKDQSQVHQILSNIQFSILKGFKIRLAANEQIDDVDFDKIIFLFDGQKVTSNSMSHILINSENANYLSPKTYYKIFQPFTSNLKMLSLNIMDNAGLSIVEWLKHLSLIIQSCVQLEQLYVQIHKFFTIILNKGYFQIKLKCGITNDGTSIEQLAYLGSKLQFNKFRLKIDEDNVIKNSLDHFGPILLNCNNLNYFSLTIGQSCQLNSTQFLQSLNLQPITTFKMKIGNSNEIGNQALLTILQLVQNQLRFLKLQVGSSTKIFKQFQLQSQYNEVTMNQSQFNKLEQLNFKIGKNNDFQNGGAKFLALLLDSPQLQMVKINIGDSNQMTDLQALSIFILLQKLRTVNILELEFERNICVNKLCLEQLEKLINKSSNLNSLSLNFAKQQQNLDFTNLFQTLGQKRNLVNLDLSIGGQQSLPDLFELGQRLKELEYLSVFKIHLKGNNNIEYPKLQQFLQLVKSNKTLNLLSIKTGSQKSSEYRQEEMNSNALLLKRICLIGTPIIIYFSHLNDQISYQYNFDRLQLIGNLQVISRDTLMPLPSNQLVVQIREVQQVDNQQLKQIYSLIKQQEYIDIQISQLLIKYQKGVSIMKADLLNYLVQFVAFTQRQITEIIIYEENFLWQGISQLLLELIRRQRTAEIPEFRFISKKINIILKNNSLEIKAENPMELNQEGFSQFCELLLLISYFEVRFLKIEIPITNFSQDWNELSNALVHFEQLQKLDLNLKNLSNNEGHCRDYKSFHQNLLKIFIENKYLTEYDQFSEKAVFPITLQYHLGNQIKELEGQITQQEAQVQRILNGNPIPGDQNIDFDQLQQSLHANKKDLEERNKAIKKGQEFDGLKQRVLLRRRRLTYQYFMAIKKYSQRLNKQQMISDIIEML